MLDTFLNYFNQVAAFNESNSYIDLIVIILFIIGGYVSKKWLASVKMNMTFKTIILGTAFCLLYIWTKSVEGTLQPGYWKKLLLSYTVATSFYETIVKYVHIGIVYLYNKYLKKIEQS